MTTRNEAAERRQHLLNKINEWREFDFESELLDAALAAAKAEGAREAVDRIRVDRPGPEVIGYRNQYAYGFNDAYERILSILQDERESSLGRDAEGHLVLTLGPGSESPSRKQTSTAWERYDGMSPLEQREADGDR